MRLTDWIIGRIENTMQITTVAIPADLDFADLKLLRTADGDVSFSTDVISRIEAASGLPDGFFMSQPEDVLGELITKWYNAHRADGGPEDPIAEDLISEVRIENVAGQNVSLRPGRA